MEHTYKCDTHKECSNNLLVTIYFARYNKELSVVDSSLMQSGVVVGVVDMPTCVDSCRMLTRCFKEDVAWKVMKSTEDHEVLQQEWTKLQEDREALRSIFPTGNTKVS